MDLLETILRAARAEEYLQNFRSEKIDAQSLKILTHEDLIMIGIKDEEVRKNILDKAEKLLINSERKVNLKVDETYGDLILLHIQSQVKVHDANLFLAANRPDVINCNMLLDDEVVSLLESVQDFKRDLRKLKLKVQNKKEKGGRWSLLFGKALLCLSTLTFLVGGNLFIYQRFFMK